MDTWMVQQKLEIVLAGLRGEVSVAEVCREHQISETLFYSCGEKLLEGGAERLSGREERTLGRKTYELEILGTGAGCGSGTARRLSPAARR